MYPFTYLPQKKEFLSHLPKYNLYSYILKIFLLMFTEYFLHVSCSPAFKLCQYPVPNNNNNNNKWLGKKLRAKSFFTLKY